MTTLEDKLKEVDNIDVGQHKQVLMKSYVRRLNQLHLDLDIDLIKLSKYSVQELRTLRANLIAN